MSTNPLRLPLAALPWFAALLLGMTAQLVFVFVSGGCHHSCGETELARLSIAQQVAAICTGPATVTAPPPTAVSTGSSENGPVGPAQRAATQVAEDRHSLSRASFDRLLEGISKTMQGGARLVPLRGAGPLGSWKGFKLSGVQPKSEASLLGLHNGDLLRSVNGQTFVAPHQLSSVALQLANPAKLQLVRPDARTRLDGHHQGCRGTRSRMMMGGHRAGSSGHECLCRNIVVPQVNGVGEPGAIGHIRGSLMNQHTIPEDAQRRGTVAGVVRIDDPTPDLVLDEFGGFYRDDVVRFPRGIKADIVGGVLGIVLGPEPPPIRDVVVDVKPIGTSGW